MSTNQNSGKIRSVLLAFLAGRSPACYETKVITQRINKSNMLDFTATEADVDQELRVMAGNQFQWIYCDVDPTTRDVVWYATEAGIKRWALDGSLYVGG